MTDSAETISLEVQVVGAALLRPDLLQEIYLQPEDFISDGMRQIWECIIRRRAKNEVIELIVVADDLGQQTGQNWLVATSAAAKACISPGNAAHYAELLRGESKARKILALGEAMQVASRTNWREIADTTVKALLDIGQASKRWECGMSEALRVAVEDIQAASDADGMVGISSGLRDLDAVLGGFHDSDLYIIGARPAMGKSALLLKLASSADCHVGIISAEQPRGQVATRLIAMHGRINANKLRNASMEESDWTRMTQAMAQLQDEKIRINDRPAPSIHDVMRQGRAWAYRGVKAIYVDYVQRIKASNQSAPKHEQVGEVVMGLKELARELDIPIIALAQVNREVEKRVDRKPRMADLKDSGTIEQEADNVMTLYRDEVYDENSVMKGIAEIDVVKNRHGPIGFVRVAWHGPFMRFDDLTMEAV